MNRIERIFADLRARNARALMPYITVGDPDLDTTAAMLPAMEQAGASVVELGFPFSDPVADGPVIQASMHHALTQGLTIQKTFEMIESVRPKVELGLVAMVSISIVYRVGIEAFMDRCVQAGVDGLIIPDLLLEESEAVQTEVKKRNLILSMLIAPTSSQARAQAIAKASSGFVYIVSRSGTTGESTQLPASLPERLNAIRKSTDLPLAVGFGVSDAQQVQQVVSVADAAIVGSALMRRVGEMRDQPREAIVQTISTFTRDLARGLKADAVKV